jgi:hypothetical protein
MKTAIGIAGGVLLGCLLVFSGLIALKTWGPFQASAKKLAAEDSFTLSPVPSLLLSPVPVEGASARTTASPSSSPPPTSPSSPTKSLGQTRTVTTFVNFDLSLTGASGSALSRQVSARLNNTGTGDAHNTSIKIEAVYQGTRLKLGGKDFLLQNLGTLNAGQNRTIQADLSFNISDGSKINKNGVDFVVTLASDEYQKTLEYNYKP